MTSLAKQGTEGNPIGIPPSVGIQVTVAQFIALVIATCTQDDVTTALSLFRQTYSSKRIGSAFEGATLTKWTVSLKIIFITGILGLAVTFLLVITSDETVELLLNFTAVEFVSLIDNVLFNLAEQGLFGCANRREAKLVHTTHYSLPPGQQQKLRRQGVFLFATFLILIAGWAAVVALQILGVYSTNSIYLQFEDNVKTELGSYSGLYVLEKTVNILGAQDFAYVATEGTGFLAYCDRKKFWTFRYSRGNPCEEFVVKSEKIRDTDIMQSDGADWMVRLDTTGNRFFVMPKFSLAAGCRTDAHCGGSEQGSCNGGKCKCTDNFYGTTCSFDRRATCETIEADEETGPFIGTREFQTTFNILRTKEGSMVTVYDHPVYVAETSETVTEGMDVMMYTGLRWLLFYSGDAFKGDVGQGNLQIQTVRHDLAEYLSKPNFHAAHVISRVEFASDIVLFDTPGDTPSPIGLEWHVVRNKDMTNVEFASTSKARLLCAVCDDETNPCLNDNVCMANRECSCDNGATGRLCQISPLSNGRCDDYYNQASLRRL